MGRARNLTAYLTILIALSLFASLAFMSSTSTRPESDEGGFANPAANLVENGHFGTTVFETEKSNLTRINKRTYWVMPLFLLNTAAYFKIFGTSLLSMRLGSIFWALVIIGAWYFLVLKVSRNRVTATLCLIFLACSYIVLATATIGRGDTMCAALGFTALAVYLWVRERDLSAAVFLSATFVVLAGLTHFLGILALLGLIFLVIYFDRSSLSLRLCFVALIPFLIGGAGFGVWVLQDPSAFWDQFVENARMGGRLGGLTSPITGLIGEFTIRYPRAFGFWEMSKGHSGPVYLKVLILIGYLCGVAGMLLTKSLRKNRSFVALLLLMTIYLITLAVLDGQKLTSYLIYIVPFYTACLAIVFKKLWTSSTVPRPVLATLIYGFLALQTVGIAYRSSQNTYQTNFMPAVEYLNNTASKDELIMGSAELRFALDPRLKHIDDGEFGRLTGKRPKYIVYDPGVADSLRLSKIHNPPFYSYFPKLLNRNYKIGYQNEAYTVYVRKN